VPGVRERVSWTAELLRTCASARASALPRLGSIVAELDQVAHRLDRCDPAGGATAETARVACELTLVIDELLVLWWDQLVERELDSPLVERSTRATRVLRAARSQLVDARRIEARR
jgi:hypothetical protein